MEMDSLNFMLNVYTVLMVVFIFFSIRSRCGKKSNNDIIFDKYNALYNYSRGKNIGGTSNVIFQQANHYMARYLEGQVSSSFTIDQLDRLLDLMRGERARESQSL